MAVNFMLSYEYLKAFGLGLQIMIIFLDPFMNCFVYTMANFWGNACYNILKC